VLSTRAMTLVLLQIFVVVVTILDGTETSCGKKTRQ
jgi:hypothetical protein